MRIIMPKRQLRPTKMPTDRDPILLQELQPLLLSPNLPHLTLININRALLFPHRSIPKTENPVKCKPRQ